MISGRFAVRFVLWRAFVRRKSHRCSEPAFGKPWLHEEAQIALVYGPELPQLTISSHRWMHQTCACEAFSEIDESPDSRESSSER